MATPEFGLNPQPEYISLSGEGFDLRANPAVLRAAAALVRSGFIALPRRGLEVGGLLLGNDAPYLCWDELHVVPIEYRFGPSYELSDVDAENIRQEICQLRRQSGLQIIGHFRSCTKGKPEVTDSDRTIAALLGEPHSLLLLIAVSPGAPCVGHFYLDTGQEPKSVLKFQVAPEDTELAPAIPELSVVGPAPSQEILNLPEQAAIVERKPAGLWLQWKALTAAGFLVCAAGALVVFGSHLLSQKPAPASAVATPSVTVPFRAISPGAETTADLGLSVRQEGSELIASWDRSSSTVQNGTSGMLTIKDGPNQHEFPLSSNALRSDTIYYTPQSESVSFRLEIYSDVNRHVGETVLVVSSPPLPVPEPSAEEPTTPRESAEVSKEIVDPHPRRSPPRRFRPPPRDALNLSTSKAPILSTPLSLPELGQAPLPEPLIAAIPAPAFPSRPASPRPPAQAAISYTPPVPVRKISPAVPTNLRSVIQEGTTIEVKVTVDAVGEVTSATAINASSASQKLLSPSAVQAAKLWRFEPAHRNGQPVGSEATLKFNFGTQAREDGRD